MPFLLRPTGETDLTNATLYPEGPLPQIISSLEPGTFDLARLEWSPQPVTVINDPTIPTDPDFAMGATGPYFVDSSNVPANTTRIRHDFEIFVPAGLSEYSGGRILVAQESTGFDVELYAIGGATYVQVERIEDSGGSNLLSGKVRFDSPVERDTWFRGSIDADLAAGQLTMQALDRPATTTDLAAGSGKFQSSREISYCGSSAGKLLLPQGVRVRFFETHLTTDGTETLRKRLAGDAATVNADPWKRGGDA
ncbi:MAG: hypothetical protein AAF264_00020 [Pseudomonadota bacterium]